MAQYLLTKVKTCPTCEGKRMVQHPAWVEYWRENADKQPMTIEEDQRWFEDHGWYRTSGDMRTDGTPDEEVFCDDCEGEGTITTEIDLLDLIPELHSKLKAYGSW